MYKCGNAANGFLIHPWLMRSRFEVRVSPRCGLIPFVAFLHVQQRIRKKPEAEHVSNQIPLNGKTGSGLARGHFKLAIDRTQMGADGSWTQDEFFSDLGIGEA